MSHFDGYCLEYSAPPGQPSVAIAYSTGSLSRSNSTTSLKSLKRKRSEDSMTVAAVTVSVTSDASRARTPPIILPGFDESMGDPYVAPPSPVPTEIVEEFVEESSEERMEAAKAQGIKVRDFAHEPLPRTSRDIRAPELWKRPLHHLILHDRYIRVHPTMCAPMRLSGKILHNLLAIGWVTQEEAKRNWRPADWEAVAAYVARPHGPYPVCIPAGVRRPTASYRAALRAETFDTMDSDVPEECIYVPPDEPGMDDGPKRVQRSTSPLPPTPTPSESDFTQPQPRQLRSANVALAELAARLEASPDDVHADKRRKVSGPPYASTTPPATPVASPRRTLSRSDSQQTIAAGSGSPPTHDEPKAPPRRRGLQRQLTMNQIPVR